MSNYDPFTKRPTKDEDEDDILRLSREFEKSGKVTPSATLVKGYSADTTSSAATNVEASGNKKSKFAQARIKNQLKREHQEESTLTENKNGRDIPRGLVLRDAVVEKVIKARSYDKDIHMSEANINVTKRPFPETILWDKTIHSPKEIEVHGIKKKVSIFAQQLSNTRQGSAQNHQREIVPMVEVVSQNREWGTESRVLKNSKIIKEKEGQDIHSENVAFLNTMTEQQLIEERKEILEKLDTSVLEFLKKKWAKPKDINEIQETDEHMISEDGENNQLILKTSDVLPKKVIADESLSTNRIHPNVEEKLTAPSAEPIVESQKVVNMNKLEPEKMEWMSDVKDDEDNSSSKKSFNARFDFSGKLLPHQDKSIPMTAALHHHGEEPARPGYTLEELLTLARSTFPQQRCIAFDTLSNIISNAKKGLFDYCFGLTPDDKNNKSDQDIKEKYVNILVQLLDADLVTLLRLSLDEAAHTSAAVLDSSVNCMAQVIDNEIEEIALDSQFFVEFQVAQQPCLKTKISSDPEFKKDETEMKDIQIMKSDLILGLLRMDVLDRFAYLLSVTKPSNPTTVVNILKILSRMCRHSMQTASIIMKHPKLISIIVDNFLPSRMVVSKTGSLYDTPVHIALKLIRLLMSWGRGFTSEILNKFDVAPKLLAYGSLVPGDSSNPVIQTQESLKLTIEAYRTWITCLRYGLLINAFIDFHPVLMSHISYLQANISMHQENVKDDKKKFNFDYAVAFIQVINCALCCIPCEKLEEFAVVDKTVAKNNNLGWEHFTGVSGIMDVLEICLKKWIVEVSRSTEAAPKYYCLNLMASCFQLLSTFIQRHSLSNLFKPAQFLSKLEDIVKHINSCMFQSKFFSELLIKTCQFSLFCEKNERDGRLRDPENLPSLGVTRYGGDIAGCLKEQSPFGFLTAYLSLVNASLKVHKSLFDTFSKEEGIVQNFLKHKNMVNYLNMFANQKKYLTRTNWFSKPELSMLFKIIYMDCQYLRSYEAKFIWKLAMTLIEHLQIGQEYELEFLLRNIIFSSNYIDSVDQISLNLSKLNIDSDGASDIRILSNNGNTPEKFQINLQESLPKILTLYHDLLLPNAAVTRKSKTIHHQLCYSTKTLTTNSNGETILPSDWQYLPLLILFHQRQSNINHESKSSIDGSADENEVENVRNCLLWVHITTIYIDHSLSSSSIALQLSRLSTVFLAAPDLFMDHQIHVLIKRCLDDTLIRASKHIEGIKFSNTKIPGIDSFKEYYEELINQFEAVSYGSQLFAMILILPLTSANSWKYRSVFWCDHEECLRLITLSESQLPRKTIDGVHNCINLQSFVVKNENKDLIRTYVKHLVRENITEKRNPLLFNIARSNVIENIKDNYELDKEIRLTLANISKSHLLTVSK